LAAHAGHEISERDYWMARTRETGALLGETWDRMETLVQRARGADPDLVVRPEMLALITQARQAGCKLAILSNELDLFYGSALRQRLSCLKDFGAIIDATYTGILKPDARAYQAALDALGLPAARLRVCGRPAPQCGRGARPGYSDGAL
jgi:putative hydrolase of the HAD superfamily